MSVDVGAPARGVIETLNANGTWDVQNNRVGGTWPGTVAAGGAYQPTQPYDGPSPAIFASSVPLITHIEFAGAGGCYQIKGTLELYYIDRLSIEQGVPLAVIDRTMTDNCTAVINAILADMKLSDSVTSVVAPLEVVRDPEGIFREWAGSPWVWCSIRVPFISKIG